MVLVIIDVFQSQMTEPVLNMLKEYKICLVKVPANMRKEEIYAMVFVSNSKGYGKQKRH